MSKNNINIGKAGNFFQEDCEMIAVAIQINDLLANHEVCYYDAGLNQDDEDQGYQRQPGLPRVTKIAKKLERSLVSDSFLPIPTSVILSDRGVKYKHNDGRLDIIDGKFKLIDGQHRLLAYKKAIDEYEVDALNTHYLSCVIIKIEDYGKKNKLTELQKKEIELKHFNTINGEAKAVPVDLGNALLVNLYQSGALKSDEYDDSKVMSMELVMKLNDESGPWQGKILMPNEKAYPAKVWKNPNATEQDKLKKHLRVVKSTSLVVSLKPLLKYLEENVFRPTESRARKLETIYTLLDNYWTVIKKQVPNAINESRDHVIQKSPGIFSLHSLLIELCKDIVRNNERITSMESFEKRLMNEELEFMSEDWWSNDKDNPGEAAKYGSMKGFKALSLEYLKQINELSDPSKQEEIVY